MMAGFALTENTMDVTARLLAQIDKRQYRHNTVSDDTGGFLEGVGVWTILPKRLTWTVEDTFQEVLLNVAAPDTPSNRAKSNTLSTGPNFTFPLSSTNSTVIGGRYGRFDVENSSSDNWRSTAYVRGFHTLAAQSMISLNYEASRVYFEPGALFPKILRKDVFTRYETQSGLNGATFDLGTTRVTRYTDTDLSGRLVRLTLSGALSSLSVLRLAFSDQISDTYSDQIAGVAATTAPGQGGVENPTGTASGDLYRSRRSDLAYVNNSGGFGYTLQGHARRVDFETLEQDYHDGGARFIWTWVPSGAMRLNAIIDYTRRTYDSFDREDRDRSFTAGMTYRVNRNVTVAVDGGRTVRESTVPSVGFVDNRVMLFLAWSSGPFFDPRLRR
jgi:hypothetical protein